MRKRRKCEVNLCQKVVQKRVAPFNVKCFLGKTFTRQKLMKSNNISAEVMLALLMKILQSGKLLPNPEMFW